MKEVESHESLIRCAKSLVFNSAVIATIVLSTLISSGDLNGSTRTLDRRQLVVNPRAKNRLIQTKRALFRFGSTLAGSTGEVLPDQRITECCVDHLSWHA
jgi:hypothetical protein